MPIAAQNGPVHPDPSVPDPDIAAMPNGLNAVAEQNIILYVHLMPPASGMSEKGIHNSSTIAA